MDNENNNSTPSTLSWRPAFWTAGPLMILLGLTVLVERWSGNTSYNSSAWSLWPSIGIILIGIVLMGFAKWFHPNKDNKAFQVLTKWGNSPAPYAIIVFLFWVSFETQQLTRNNELATLRNDEQSIAKVIDRLVLPRRLTDSQKSQITKFLSQFEPHEYAFKVSARDQEANKFKEDIDNALLKGGWSHSANPFIYTDDLQPGLNITFMQTPEHNQKTIDPRNPSPALLLQEALGTAGVRILGVGGGSGVGITQDSLVITVGPARRDSFNFDPDFTQ